MKYPLIMITALALLSGCAKVTQEPAICTGTPPPAPQVSNVVAQTSYSTEVSPANMNSLPYGSKIVWRGPNNFSTTGSTLYLNGYSSAINYGLYTATTFLNGCSSVPDTFYVYSDYVEFPGGPPCTISPSQYNKIYVGDSIFNFPYQAGSQYGYCSGSNTYLLHATTSAQWDIDVYTSGAPRLGYYCELQTSCNVQRGQVYVEFSNNEGTYTPVSGKVYFNQINGQNYITFCDAVFKITQYYTGTRQVTVHGNLRYN